MLPPTYWVVEGIVALKMSVVIGVREGTNLSSHSGVSSYFSTFQVCRNLSMNRGGHSHLSQEQSHTHISLRQSHGSSAIPPDGPQIRVIKIHVDLDLDTRNQ